MKKVGILLFVFALALFGGIKPLMAADTAQDRIHKSYDASNQQKMVTVGLAIHQDVTDTDLAAGGDLQTLATVPAGKVWYVQRVGYLYTGTITNVRVALLCGGVTVDQDEAPVSGEAQSFSANPCVLSAGETVQIDPIGSTAGDDLYGSVHAIQYDMPNPDS
jgi:hypothetical protein